MIIHRHKSGKCLLVFHGDTFDTWIWFLRISPKTVIFKPSNNQWPFLSNKILPPRTGKNNRVEKKPVEMNKSSFPHPPNIPLEAEPQGFEMCSHNPNSPVYQHSDWSSQIFSDLYLHRPYWAVYFICWKFKFNLTPNYITFYV